jgi:hypothetical protein
LNQTSQLTPQSDNPNGNRNGANNEEWFSVLALRQGLMEREHDITRREHDITRRDVEALKKLDEITRRDLESLRMLDEVLEIRQAADTLQINRRVDGQQTQIDQNSARIGRLEDGQRTISKSFGTIRKTLRKAGFVLSPGDESEASTRKGGLFSDDEEDDDERNDGLVVGGEESERNDQNGLLEFSGEEGTCE